MSNLAPPAPLVEPATAEMARPVTPTNVERAHHSSSVDVGPAPAVEPATILVAQPSAITTQTSLSVAALRGQTGADFESYAAILRGAPPKNCLKRYLPCLYDERDYVAYSEVKKYAVVKSGHCFVYIRDDDPSPLYAIDLAQVYAVEEDRQRMDPCSVTVSPQADFTPRRGLVTVLLKYRNDHSQAYQFTFDTETDPSLAKRFQAVVELATSNKHRPVTASLIHAKEQGKMATKYQPDI